jgi:transcriptional regulator with XRE-family HTH domain
MKRTKRGPLQGQTHKDVKRSPFGKRLFSTRKARGISQAELGEKIGLSKRMVSFYEGDTQGPPVDVVIKMAAVLNVTTSYLLGESPMKIIKDEMTPSIRKHVDTLQKLPPKDQKAVMRMIEGLAVQNGVTAKAAHR